MVLSRAEHHCRASDLDLAPLPGPLRCRTSHKNLRSDQSGDVNSGRVPSRAQSDLLQSAPASFTFLGETHSQGIVALTFPRLFPLFVSFHFFPIFYKLQWWFVQPSHAAHVAHTVVTHREPLHRCESPSLNGAHYVVHRAPSKNWRSACPTRGLQNEPLNRNSGRCWLQLALALARASGTKILLSHAQCAAAFTKRRHLMRGWHNDHENTGGLHVRLGARKSVP